MKKLLALVLALSLALTACGGGAPAKEPAKDPAATPDAAAAAPAKEAKLDFGTGGTTGTYYAYGGVLSQIISEKVPGLTITVQSTGASKANILGVSDGEMQLGLVQNDVMSYAYKGTDLFEGDAITNFSVVGALYAEVCQIVTTGDIKTIEDLKGKRVSVGDAGSGVEFNARQILEAYDIKFEDIKVNNLGFGDSADAIKDGKIDAFFCTAGAPTTAIVELATTKGINLLEIDTAHADKLAKAYPYYTTFKVPSGSYKGVDKDVQTVAIKATIIVGNDVAEETVYNFTKALFENKADITAAHAKGAELDAKYAVAGVSSVPFHPGAAKYYKEVGAI
ncbi:MAG: TAXI family TRAP transporter solute-binding subunit [Oscillospiraceae bacterium]